MFSIVIWVLALKPLDMVSQQWEIVSREEKIDFIWGYFLKILKYISVKLDLRETRVWEKKSNISGVVTR